MIKIIKKVLKIIGLYILSLIIWIAPLAIFMRTIGLKLLCDFYPICENGKVIIYPDEISFSNPFILFSIILGYFPPLILTFFFYRFLSRRNSSKK